MLKNIKNKIKLVRAGLTTPSDHPIGKAVLAIVLFLDLFILISIFQGLSDHTRQLVTPNEYIPQYCRDIVIDGGWNENNRLIRIAEIVSIYRSSYVYINEKDRINEVHPFCVPILKLLRSIEDDKTLSEALSIFLRHIDQITQVKSALERTKGAYDTALLEEIAKQNTTAENTTTLKSQVSELTEKLNNLANKEATSVSLLMQNKDISQLFNLVESSSKQKREMLLEELRHLNFWFPVKRLGMEAIFLLPLVIIFFLWNSSSITASRTYQTLVSSHLLVIVFIPVIFKVIELIYDIVPKKLLKHIFELLKSLNLIAIWHYVIMGVSVIAAIALIYFMQKKIFSQEKITQKRITRGQCQNCGTHLPSGSNVCSICGFKQFRECSHCNKGTYVYGKYCRECGAIE